MSEPIGPGDWVECVKQDLTPPPILRVGAIYSVEAINIVPPGYTDSGEPQLVLVGVDAGFDPVFGHQYWGFDPSYFRPIYRPKASIIEALKAPVTRTPQVVKPIRDAQKVNAQ